MRAPSAVLPLLPLLIAIGACTASPAPSDAGSPGDSADSGGASSRAVPLLDGAETVVGTAADGLANPRDLQFDPEVPTRLWTVNQATDATVIYESPGTPDQTSANVRDWFAGHFMADVSSLAFGQAGTFATCQESQDDWNEGPQPPDNFMGPTLWSSDLAIYAQVGQADLQSADDPEGSHLDMMHESPLCMGIEWDEDNQYWAFDGYNGTIAWYDFRADHGPGGGNHNNGRFRRYVEATVTRVAGVPSHLALDAESGWLYFADTGTGRVLRLDTASGGVTGDGDCFDYLAECSIVEGVTLETVAEGLTEPSGVALHDGRLWVTDHATGAIVVYELDGTEVDRQVTSAVGIMGLTFDDAGRLWYADGDGDRIVAIGL